RYGGAEAYGVELMRELAQRHDVTVFGREYDPDCNLTLPFISLLPPRGIPSWLRALVFALRARRAVRAGFDIVHSHVNGYCGDIEVVHVTPVRYNWRVRSMPRLKKLLSYTSIRVLTYLRLEKARLRVGRGRRIVAVSELIAEQLRQAYGADRQFPVVPPGVIRPDVNGDALRNETRARLNYGTEDHVSLLVARNPMRKGLPTALRALAKLPTTYKLLVVGANSGAREYLRTCAERAALEDRVTLLKETSDVAPYYLAADLYVHPTLNDSFGMAPLEAMSYGLPVVVSPAPWCGFAQYLRPELDALVLSHPEAHEELAAAIKRIVEEPGLAAKLRAAGDEVVDLHSWKEVARRYEDLYAQVLAERAGKTASLPDDDLQVQ